MTISNLHKVSEANLFLLLVKILPRTLHARSLAALLAGIAKYRLAILDNIGNSSPLRRHHSSGFTDSATAGIVLYLLISESISILRPTRDNAFCKAEGGLISVDDEDTPDDAADMTLSSDEK